MKRRGTCWLLPMAVIAGFAWSGVLRAQTSNFPNDPASLASGEVIAEKNCAACHAIGAEGDSPNPNAPVFRELSQRYPVSDLEESLAEGIVTGHNDMPEFVLEPGDIDRFLGYLESIQVQRDKS